MVAPAVAALAAASAAAMSITSRYAPINSVASSSAAPLTASPSAATASRLPARAAALLTPDAVLAWSSGAESSTVVVSGATAMVMPTATTTSPGATPPQYVPTLANAPSSA